VGRFDVGKMPFARSSCGIDAGRRVISQRNTHANIQQDLRWHIQMDPGDLLGCKSFPWIAWLWIYEVF
jgi:hypothetical protein